mgnify:CR=1 FL=1
MFTIAPYDCAEKLNAVRSEPATWPGGGSVTSATSTVIGTLVGVPSATTLMERYQLSAEALVEQVNLLNLVNFGGGCYAVYAELDEEGMVNVQKELYGEDFRRRNIDEKVQGLRPPPAAPTSRRPTA